MGKLKSVVVIDVELVNVRWSPTEHKSIPLVDPNAVKAGQITF